MTAQSHSDSTSASTSRLLAGVQANGAIPELRLATFSSDSAEPTYGSLPAQIDTLIIPVFQGTSGLELAGGPGALLTQAEEIQLWKLLVSVGARGSKFEVTAVPGFSADDDVTSTDESDTSAAPTTSAITCENIIAVGLGDIEEVTEETIREAAGFASRAVSATEQGSEGSTDSATGARVVSTLGIFGPEAAVVGHALGAYRYTGARTEAGSPSIASVTVLAHATEEDPEVQLNHARIVVDAVAFARDLVNAPANELYPASYADIISAAAADLGLEIEVLDETELAERGFGGIIGVGKGSSRPPRLVQLSYSPEGASDDDDLPSVALVGKGITFDTGGISLKPPANMWDMISDMGGSAAVIGAILGLARLGVQAKVTATVPLAENMPSGEATRPGDILRHYGGKTTEVLNTDAEGRLVLADAIAYACEDEPDYLIETATLTGAQMVALGNRTPGIMGSIDFRDRISRISQEVGENGWPMPLPAELGEALKSDVADLRNISGNRWGGMAVAGHYLSNFVADGIQWVHIDVAGPVYNTDGAHGYTPKRATGVPVRTIIATVEDIAEKR